MYSAIKKLEQKRESISFIVDRLYRYINVVKVNYADNKRVQF